MNRIALKVVMSLGFGICAVPLVATPCTVGNGCLSDRLWIVNPDGVQVYGKPVQEYREVANKIYYIGVTGLIDPTMYGKPDILLEPPKFDSVSDAVGVVFVGGQFYLGFKSDSDTGIPPITWGTGKPTFLDETNARLDVTQFLNPELRSEGYTAYFRSDVVEPPVPEPSTALLLAGGTCVLAAMRRRRARRT